MSLRGDREFPEQYARARALEEHVRPEVEDPGEPHAAGLRDLKCLAEGHTDPQVRAGRARQVGGGELLEVVVAENLSATVPVEDLENQVGGAEPRAGPKRRLDVQAEPQLDREVVLEGKSFHAAGCLSPRDLAHGTVHLIHARTVANGRGAPGCQASLR